MKKLFRSRWTLAILALVLGLGTQIAVLALRFEAFATAAEAAAVVDLTAAPARIVWDFITPEIDQLRDELKDRLEGAGKREEELREYEKRLKAERAELEKLKREIEAVRTELSTRLIEIETSEQKNLKTLANTYSGISPEAAIAIFKEMNDEMVVKILSFMKPDPVGQIFELMARTKDGEGTLAERAASLSNKLRLLRQVRAEQNS